jgi:hypothetical protein
LKKDFDPPKLNHPSVLSPLRASSLIVGNRTKCQVGAQTPITQKKIGMLKMQLVTKHVVYHRSILVHPMKMIQ